MLRVQSEALARADSTSSTSALIRCSSRAGHDDERFDASLRVERVLLDEARIDDEDDAGNCDTRLGDVRGQDDLASAFRCRLKDLRLLLGRERGVDGRDLCTSDPLVASARTIISLMELPRARVVSSSDSCIDSISSWPVKKTRMSPLGCEVWIWKTVVTAACR